MGIEKFNQMKIEINEMLISNIEHVYQFCSNVNMFEFLSYSTFLSWIGFDPKEGYKYMSPLEFEYLIGVFLTLEYDNTKVGKGTIEENGKLLKNLEELISTWKLSNSFRKIDGKTAKEDIEKALFEANHISTSGTMRGYSWYPPSEKIRNDVFEPFNEFFKNNIGFDINDIYKFDNIITGYYQILVDALRTQIRKSIGDENLYSNEELRYELFHAFHLLEYKDILFFSIDDIQNLNKDIDTIALRKFLDFFSIIPGIDKNDNYKYFNDKNKFRDHPIIKSKDKYFIINFSMVQWCLKDRLEYVIKNNNAVWKKYNKNKSDYLENATIDLFRKIFPTAKIYQSLYYNSLDGKRCELDGLIQYDNCILLIEAKSGIFAKSAQNGGVKRLKKVIYENIEYAAYQAHRAKEYIIETETPIFENEHKKEILRLNKNGFENIFLLNITMEYFSELSTNIKQLKNLGFYSIKDFPWSVSLGDLKIITDFIQFPNQFLHYIYFREKFSNKVIIRNNYKHFYELDLFGFYLFEEKEDLPKYFIEDVNENTIAYNMYCKTEHPIESRIPDFSSIYNEYYNKSLQNISAELPKKRYNNEFYKMVHQLEEYSCQGKGYTNFILKLLDLDNIKQDQIIKHIYNMVSETEKSKEIKINSMPFLHGNFDDKATYGITITCGYQYNKEKMYEILKATCIKNRYSYRYSEWLGLCSFVDNTSHLINFFMLVKDDTKYDEKLENILKILPTPKIKIGRNDQCPCGSGKKYKKCHGG